MPLLLHCDVDREHLRSEVLRRLVISVFNVALEDASACHAAELRRRRAASTTRKDHP